MPDGNQPAENQPAPGQAAHEYVDDESILDDAVLWRRIRPNQVVPNEDGTLRPSSEAFRDRTNDDGVSAYLADGLRDPKLLLIDPTGETDYTGWSVVAFSAGLARENGRGVCRDEAELPGHVVLFAQPGITKSQVKKRADHVAMGSSWVIDPP